MPDPITTGALISGGAQLLGAGANAWSQGNLNRRNRAFAREMYNRQYQDNLLLWQLQNSYNSPAAQMKRYQEAGLNPNLIYGQQNTGGPIQTPDVQTPQTRAPEWGNAISAAGLGYINAIYDLEIKQAQVNNMQAQNDAIVQETLLKGVQTDRGRFDLGLETELRDTSLQARQEQLRQLKVNTDVTMRRDAREALQNASSLAEAVERMANLRDQRLTMEMQRAHTFEDMQRIKAERARIRTNVEGMRLDNTIKRLDIKLREKGINPADPMWARYLANVLPNIVESGQDFFEGVRDGGNVLLDWLGF